MSGNRISTSGLDEKAVAIAEAAYMAAPEGEDALRVFLRAYLASTTPADVGEEPVAWRWRTEIFREWNLTDVKPGDQTSMECETGLNMSGLEVEPLYSATALERVVRERDEFRDCLATQCGKTLATEAKLAEARKVIEPFAEVASEWDGEPESLHVFLEWNDDGGPVPSLTVAEFRAARRWIEEMK